MSAPDVDALRSALRLHLAPLTPLQRARIAAGGGARRSARDGIDAWRAVTDASIDAELERAASVGARIMVPGDPAWPELLSEMPDPPHALWVRGRLPDPSALVLAVVGARRPSPYGLAVARRLAGDLAGLGFVVVSGGALGVDAEAHRAALDQGAPTVAVLGCGIDVVYPPQHRSLFRALVEHGALVSEHPCGTPPLRHHFPVRNRLLAGWSRAVLVVEATLKSGSLITAHLALQQGRDVLAVPGPVTSRLSEGTNDLLARGAGVARRAKDIVATLRPDELQRLRVPAPAGDVRAAADDGIADPVLRALPPAEARDLDQLLDATGLPVGPLMARLVELETRGIARSLAGGYWMRAEVPR